MTKAAILAIGTELTSGQITNRNAAWISEQLDGLGIATRIHITVADDASEILDAIDACTKLAPLLFITGGLGPTSDDFTRKIVAQWMGVPLIWHDPSWSKIQARLSAMGIPVAEANRQQCYFPQGSRVLSNSEGTADAFALNHAGAQVWVLPGPPREIQAVWTTSIQSELKKLFPAAAQSELLLWQLLGKSEAEVGEITEAALAGSGFQTGYRAHRPYVEVKVWVPAADQRNPSQNLALERLNQALSPWVVARGKPEFDRKLVESLWGHDSVWILDLMTQGMLAESISPQMRAQAPQHALNLEAEWVIHTRTTGGAPDPDPEASVRSELEAIDSETLSLALAGPDALGNFALGMCRDGQIRTQTWKSPWKVDPAHPTLRDRSLRFACETALRVWAEWLGQPQTGPSAC